MQQGNQLAKYVKVATLQSPFIHQSTIHGLTSSLGFALRPTILFKAAGTRPLPAVSVPKEKVTCQVVSKPWRFCTLGRFFFRWNVSRRLEWHYFDWFKHLGCFCWWAYECINHISHEPWYMFSLFWFRVSAKSCCWFRVSAKSCCWIMVFFLAQNAWFYLTAVRLFTKRRAKRSFEGAYVQHMLGFFAQQHFGKMLVTLTYIASNFCLFYFINDHKRQGCRVRNAKDTISCSHVKSWNNLAHTNGWGHWCILWR